MHDRSENQRGRKEPKPAATLEFRHVAKRYPGQDRPAIEDLSFTVDAGEICVLVGPSGCGKTTAMRLVNRMIEISGGEVLIDGRSVHDRSVNELRRDIGYAIQDIGLFPHRTVADNIATLPRVLGWDKQRIRARVDELLELVGLPLEVRDRYPAQLSGGQQQRVGVARALSTDPPLLLMDEPFGAVDPIARERLQNEFLRLQARLRKTIVFVTHDIDEALKMGDKVAVMQVGGQLAQYAAPAVLLAEPANDFVASFVGADRGLKRLSLQRVRDIELWSTVNATEGDDAAEIRGRLGGADVPWALLVDADNKPVGWIEPDKLREGKVTRGLVSPDPPVIVERDDVLRDALSDLLSAESHYGVVVDPYGHVENALSIDAISHAINSDPSKVPSTAEMLAARADDEAVPEPESQEGEPAL
ncbi:MAG: osmoprotectant transport system ATP-binding protein [Solirubrobacteraceae bacterium]|jgi:osmoprotectant transport system ATP-binding protein|nr:osmoprotectant transport system ATP-binding protein [Solirubrobacteraceae bacterium]